MKETIIHQIDRKIKITGRKGNLCETCWKKISKEISHDSWRGNLLLMLENWRSPFAKIDSRLYLIKIIKLFDNSNVKNKWIKVGNSLLLIPSS